MAREKRYPRVLSKEDFEKIKQSILRATISYTEAIRVRQQQLLKELEEKGKEDFTYWIAYVSESHRADDFEPNPRFYPELKEKLEEAVRTGYRTEGLRASRVGLLKPHKIRFELPLDADVKDYVGTMLAYQEYFRSLEKPNSIAKHIADEYGKGKSYPQLAKELNEAIIKWANGEETDIDSLGLDEFLRKKGFTPDNYELYDGERIRRMVRYFWTKK